MKRVKTHLYFVFLFLSLSLYAQVPKFNMSDTTVSVCKGQFFDSGGPNAIYKINEDLTFTISTGSQITLTFTGLFCVEQGLDQLRFFDGPDTNSTQIGGIYSGTTSPGTIVANSGALTIHFKSDLSVAYCGWSASWTSLVTPPVPPDFQIAPPLCNDTVLLLTLTSGYRCDFVTPGSFSVTGPVNPAVTTATPLSCNSNSTTSIRLGLSEPLKENCSYTVRFDMNIYDNCDSLWNFTKYANTVINSCSFTVSIKASNDTICGGTCTQLTAIPSAQCFNYTYTWSHGLPSTAGPHSVCPLSNTTYTVTIQEISGGATATITQLIAVNTPKINPLASDTICQSKPPFNFTASPPGGIWNAMGILDTITGLFYPDTAGAGTFYIKYKINNTCIDSLRIVIKELDAGFDDAACVGGPAFQVSGGLPLGGTWSGSPFINSTGIFNPGTTGTYTIMYSHPNGCSETKKVFVNTLQLPLTIDTICQSIWFDSLCLYVSPAGGRFYGNGIIDSIYGIFVPEYVSPGINTITYKLGNGCSGTFNIFVKEMDVEPYWSACPTQGQFMLPAPSPLNGIWTGPGIIDPNGLYDPAAGGLGDHTDILLYNAPNGCQDTLVMDSYTTDIADDRRFFCESDPRLRLNRANVDHFPTNGVWSGTGVTYNSSNNRYYFNPSIAKAGVHTLTYLKNTCSDTIQMIVFPDTLSTDSITICSAQPAFLVDSLIPAGANWSGSGINANTGLFNPAVTGNGTFTINYDNPGGCSDSMIITVYPYQAAKLNGLSNAYCMGDSSVTLNLVPAGGILTGKGISGITFDPDNAGAGQFYIKYSYGSGYCLTEDSVSVTVFPAVKTNVTVSEDSICSKGGGSLITVNATGGDVSKPYTYVWSNGAFPVNSQVVTPSATTTYYVTTSNFCSATDTVTIVVNPPITATITTSPLACYGNPGFATVTLLPPGNYSYKWNTVPIQTTSSMNGTSGRNYLLSAQNLTTGCKFDTLVKIPSYPFIKALFSPNPNLSCIPIEDNLVTFIDLSNGADTGSWNFGGTIIPYLPGQHPQFKFKDPGNYPVLLTVSNQGACLDSFLLNVCILESEEIFIPDIFSPDNDGQNDVLYVRGKGIVELEFFVYDRWGEKVFESKDPLKGWDGNYKGKAADPAVYIYYVKAVLNTGKTKTQKGDITLIR